MLKSKWIDYICITAAAAAVGLTVLFMHGNELGFSTAHLSPEYADKLFEDDYVHTIDIQMDDWNDFLEFADDEMYLPCTIVIDGEVFEDVGIRAKGNSSRTTVRDYGLERYSMKIEFDYYDDRLSYYGLDKFCLDSSFMDNSYMKTWLALDMMDYMEIPTPLCSYAEVFINGEEWGLFLAVEEPEDGFAQRNFGVNHGLLYKPDFRHIDDENTDVALRYVDEEFESYDNIFRKAKFDITDADKRRMIQIIKTLSSGDDLETILDIDEVLKYFIVQTFIVNLDSYLGKTAHNYFLYEKEGKIRILPWDFNLGFGTYALTGSEEDSTRLVNYPIDTPVLEEYRDKRPLFMNIMKHEKYIQLYHEYFDQFIREYFESGYFGELITDTSKMIAQYVNSDPTTFCSWDRHLLAVDTLQQFCLLRAESVRGQLEGTIASTTEGQEMDFGKLIDSSRICLSDLGENSDLEKRREEEKVR